MSLRIVHSLVHLSYNNVIHRLAVFAASNLVVVGMWGLIGVRLMNAGASKPW